MLLAVALGLALWWLPGSERPAMAHANLADARPAPNSVLETAPEAVIAWFTEPIEAGLSEIRVLDSSGARVDRGDTAVDPNDPTAMSVGLEPLANGTYTVAWKNVSTVDGHRVRGSFPFSVGEPLSAVEVDTPDQPLFQSPWEPVVRWAILIAALAVVGGLSFDLLVLRPAMLDRRASPAVRRVGASAAARGLRVVWLGMALLAAASTAQLLLQAGRTFETSWLGAVGGPAWSIATETEWGRLWLWRVGFILASSAVLAAVYVRFRETRPAAPSATPSPGCSGCWPWRRPSGCWSRSAGRATARRPLGSRPPPCSPTSCTWRRRRSGSERCSTWRSDCRC